MLTVEERMEMTKGILYLVPTPIGNLGDMTFRAVDILKSVDLILAEDTRHTLKLLNHFEITTKQLSFHEHNTQSRLPEIMALLNEGQSIAQVSDAGTPSISDPGYELVALASKESIKIVPLPGANAGITALIASGLTPQPFLFYGFLERKKQNRMAELENLKNHSEAVILYESPYRIKKLLSELAEVYGEAQPICIARELTKTYEEFIRGTVCEVLERTKDKVWKGELVVIVGPHEVVDLTSGEEDYSHLTVLEHVDLVISQDNLTSKEAIKKVAKLRQLPKQVVYRAYHEQ
ncbi:16S rRNA (cytidine(1402)-2'-O)-methyltransferase [Bavariicoccus seileri]|uniref:16S rRNA (cytidine(1402)-2'-O)-methyltransferase n=1 Tax=Bavariicoccus seileri TaxID=549685 RepID=UPI00047DE7EA